MKSFLFILIITLFVTPVFAFNLVENKRPSAKIYLESLDEISRLDDQTPEAIGLLPDYTKPGKLNRAIPQTPFKTSLLERQQEIFLAIAVKDLVDCLKKMSGCELEIVTTSNSDKIKPPAIIIGKLANRLGVQPRQKSVLGEAFRIKIDNDHLFIGGGSPVGTAYGIYELLSQLGCAWIMPGADGEIIPKRDTVSISNMDMEQSPSFTVRCPVVLSHPQFINAQELIDFDYWKLRNKLQINRFIYPRMMIGGHVWGLLIKQYKEEFNKNPNMLALIRLPDGSLKRQGPQLETTNPKVIDLFADYIRHIFQENNWPKDKDVCIGVGPSDGGGYSESPESIAASSGKIEPMTGKPDITDLQILLCNQILEKIGKEFPNLHLGFFLYNVHGDYPIKYEPDPRIQIVVADISYSRFHSINDLNSKSRACYKKTLEQWSAQHLKYGNELFFRGYNNNLAERFLPYTKLKIWGEDIPYYHKLGFTGLYMEYSLGSSVLAPSDYLEAKLSWNASLNWQKVLADYCKKAFGKGAPYLEQYYLMLANRQSQAGQEAGAYYAFGLIYDKGFIAKASSLFDEAFKAADSPEDKKRITDAEIPLKMLDLFLDFRAAYCAFDFPKAQRLFGQIRNDLNQYAKANGLISRAAINLLNITWKSFIGDAVKYSTGEYQIVYRLPERMKTALDPHNSGQDMGYFRPEINDRDYFVTSTYLSTWDAQGLAGYRTGSVWYRTDFKLPADIKKQPVGLFIGGADSMVRVWCNGKEVGADKGFSKPFEFDLTDSVNYDGENCLAIQVRRISNSELGTGGLIYPSFIFAGPRVKTQSNKSDQASEEILPGGVRAITPKT